MAEQVVLGAGVVGLYTALILARACDPTKITVMAKYLPGDQSINYTSPTAGANFSGISGSSPAELEYDRVSYPEIGALCDEYGERAGIRRLPTMELFGAKPADAKLASLRSYLPDFEEITDDDFLARCGAVFGVRYTTFNFYAPAFLKFLHRYLSDLGVTFVRRDIAHIRNTFAADTRVVFNCSGGGAGRLGGVRDKACYPIRGQVVVVRAPHVQENRSLFVPGHPPTYIIPRPFSGGRVVLGGYYQEGNYSPDTYAYETASILDRARRLMPEIAPHDDFEILDERAGLRPGRQGGTRIERETIDGKLVIHNYGAAGTGFQSGIGMAIKAVALYEPASRL